MSHAQERDDLLSKLASLSLNDQVEEIEVIGEDKTAAEEGDVIAQIDALLKEGMDEGEDAAEAAEEAAEAASDAGEEVEEEKEAADMPFEAPEESDDESSDDEGDEEDEAPESDEEKEASLSKAAQALEADLVDSYLEKIGEAEIAAITEKLAARRKEAEAELRA